MIVGLCGFIGSGKGTVADILVRDHGFIKESFANSVKDAVSVIFGWNRIQLEGATAESRAWRETKDEWWSHALDKEFTPRLALQLMGTEAGRDVFHQDLWIHTLFRRVDPNENYVIADVRFPNEIRQIQNYGGKCIRVRRGPDPDLSNAHKSETALLEASYDYTIENDGSLTDLSNRVDNLVKILYNKD